MIVGLYGVSLCLLMPSVLCIGGFGELGELVVNSVNSFASVFGKLSLGLLHSCNQFYQSFQLFFLLLVKLNLGF